MSEQKGSRAHPAGASPPARLCSRPQLCGARCSRLRLACARGAGWRSWHDVAAAASGRASCKEAEIPLSARPPVMMRAAAGASLPHAQLQLEAAQARGRLPRRLAAPPCSQLSPPPILAAKSVGRACSLSQRKVRASRRILAQLLRDVSVAQSQSFGLHWRRCGRSGQWLGPLAQAPVLTGAARASRHS